MYFTLFSISGRNEEVQALLKEPSIKVDFLDDVSI